MAGVLQTLALLLTASFTASYFVLTLYPALESQFSVRILTIYLCVVSTFLLGFYNFKIYPDFLTPLRHLPSPAGAHWLFGHGRVRIESLKGDSMRRWIDEVANEGLLYVRDQFGADAVMPTRPELLRAVLVDNAYDYQKEPRIQNILRRLLGDGLILVEGAAHKFQRKHLLPSFQVKVIRDLYPLFWAKTCELIDLLAIESNTSKEIEMNLWTTRVTLDIIGVAGFGKDFAGLSQSNNPLVKAYNGILEPDTPRKVWFALNFVLPHWLVQSIPFWKVPAMIESTSKSLHEYATSLVKERRAALANEKESSNARDILSLLIRSEDFSDAQLADQVLTIMAAGHETTSSTLAWTLFLLAKHPEFQIQVRQEVREHLPRPSSETRLSVSASIIDALPNLNAACNEASRLYPTVPFDARVAIRPTKLQDTTLPAGTTVFIPPWAYNRSRAFWGADAQEFRPQRWISTSGAPNNNGGAGSNYAIMTFLHGPRSCIGQGFAKSELKCIVAGLVSKFQFEISRDLDTYYPAGLVTTKPKHGMWLRVKEVPYV